LGRVTYEINGFGLRGPDVSISKPPGTFRVICLGDSFTFGEGVRLADTYPARLEVLLTDTGVHRRVEVINAGVQSYGTREAMSLFLRQGMHLQPDLVTLGFFLNDATDAGVTVQQHGARTEGPELSLPARVSRLWEIFERKRRMQRLRDEFFQTTRDGFDSELWEECKELLDAMEQLSRKQNFRFVVVLFPILWQLDGDYPFEDLHALVAGACRDAGCEFIDLLDAYRGRPAQSLWVHPTDQHPNDIAHRLAAEHIAQYLTAQPR
jgi:lysophospholipase L1-like esterase